MLDISHEPDLGYIFFPSDVPHYPGYPRLDVILTEVPTERHFDPIKVQFQIISPSNHVTHLTVHHPWTAGEKYRVGAGRIFILDRIDKKVEAFSFGGALQIFSDRQRTICALTSTAPILELHASHNLPMWLASEVEILLAEQIAHWQMHHHNVADVQPTHVDPFLLYVTCLQALQEKSWPVREDEYGAGPHFVQNEIKRLQVAGRWPLLVPSLAQLLSVSPG